ncbi:hypothetical protein KR059_008508 [Drosophila kikkawai]|nr:hypothetical protein KR059_008508 [Drosophila kikkawai]
MFFILVIVCCLPLWVIASNNSSELEFTLSPKCHPLMDCEPYFSLAGFAKVSWLEANHICNQVGSVLATVRNKEHHQLMLDYVFRNEKYFGNMTFWLGATNLVYRSYSWTWLSTGIPVTYAQWAKREPKSNRRGQDACLILDSGDHMWHSANCSEKNFFICENICMLDYSGLDKKVYI